MSNLDDSPMIDLRADGIAPVLSLCNVTKSYADSAGGTTEVLSGLDLEVYEGEFVAVLGFSGSGKTTLVSAIAGLTDLDAGEVRVRSEKSVGPGRDRGVVFQSYSLLPWLTVEGNVALAVDAVHEEEPAHVRQQLVDDTIDLVGLSHAKDRKIAALSGGMKQRVAVARALSGKPEILLMDEPLSALDALTRAKLQDEIERIRSQEKRTILLITNDLDEALLLADRVAILGTGPGAKITHTFDVDIERPRDRTQVSDDEHYVELRAEIVEALDEMNSAEKLATQSAGSTVLPELDPKDLDARPEAYTKATIADRTSRYLEFYKAKKVYPTPDGPLTVIDDINLSLIHI